jgi:gliding motility-associated-like protein
MNVFIDNPAVFSRLVTVYPPPGEDKFVQVYYTLLNAPRYNNTVIIQRRKRGEIAFGNAGAANPKDSVFEDKTALTDSLSYEYRAVIVNLCGDSIYSNSNTDILLRGKKTGPFSMSLNFTDYLGWPNGVERYELHRLLENQTGFTLYNTYYTPQSAFFDNGKDHYGQYFRIKAIENGPLKRESWSNDIRIFYEPVIFIPNAFSPDANGINERFLPAAGGMKTYKFTIYSRWGEKLFTTLNSEIGWDGKYLGKPCPSGVYIYVCEYTDFRDKVYSTKGTLHLMR